MRRRLSQSEGFTLIELLIVLIIIGILLAIAVPAYLGFKDRAQKRAAASNVRIAIPSVEAYASDFGSYTGMSIAALQLIDRSVSLNAEPVVSGAGDSYCIQSDEDGPGSGTKHTFKYDSAVDAAPVEAACS